VALGISEVVLRIHGPAEKGANGRA